MTGSCEYGNEPSGSKKAGEFSASLATISFTRRILLHGVN
jgi:hypothetical protein